MAKSYEEVKGVISTIINEVEDGANTANRIGGAMADIVDYTKEVTDVQGEEFLELKSSTEQKLNDLVVQETGNGEGVVMSQKAVTQQLTMFENEIKTQVAAPRTTEANYVIDYQTGVISSSDSANDYMITTPCLQGEEFDVVVTGAGSADYRVVIAVGAEKIAGSIVTVIATEKLSSGKVLKKRVVANTNGYIFVFCTKGRATAAMHKIESNFMPITKILDMLGSDGNTIDKTYSWESYGILIDGTFGDNDTISHTTPIDLNKGDIVICQGGTIGATYCKAARVVDGAYIPIDVNYSGFDRYAYLANEAEQVSFVGKSASIKVYNSTTLADIVIPYVKNDDIVNQLKSTDAKLNNELYVKWYYGYIQSDGKEASSSSRKKTDYIYVGNLYRLRISANGMEYSIHYYDDKRNWLGSDDRTTIDRVINFNNYIPTEIIKNAKYVRVVAYYIENTIVISADSMSSVYNHHELLNNKNVKCLAHQGVGVVNNNAGIRGGNGNNRLSGFWGAYKEGFDVNLCNQVFSSDGVCYCNHDGYFTDDITGETIVISNHTSEEIDACLLRGEPIPKLEDVIYLSKMLGMGLWLVNAGAEGGNAAKRAEIIRLIKKYQMWDNTYIMTSEANATDFLTACKRANIALIQSEIPSTEYSQISDMFAAAERIKTDHNTIYLWVNSAHSTENLIMAAENIPEGVKLGCYNVQTDDLARVLPYVSIYSHHYLSFGVCRRDIEMHLADKYPHILRDYNNII